jgi:hypothetical protein
MLKQSRDRQGAVPVVLASANDRVLRASARERHPSPL